MEYIKDEPKSHFTKDNLSPPPNRVLVSFGMGSVGIFAISVFLTSFLLIYGVSILGLPSLFVGTIYSISQVIYAIFLPIFGSLSDYLRNHKMGIRTPLIVIGIPLIVIIYHLFWNIPPSPHYGTVNFTSASLFIITLFLFRLFLALIWAPYQASIPDLTKDEKMIIKINVYLNIFAYIGQVVGMFLPNIILSQYPIPDGAFEDYYWINNPNGIGSQIRLSIQSNLFVLDIIFIGCLLITAFIVRIPKIRFIEPIEQQSTNMRKGFLSNLFRIKQLVSNPQSRNIFYLLCANFFFTITIISINFILINFALYFLKLGVYLYYYSLLIVCISFSSFFLSGLIATKLGLKKALLFCSFLSAFCFFLMFIVFIPNTSIWIQIIAGIFFLIISFLAGSIGIYFNSLIAKITVSSDLSKKGSISGNYMGLFSAFSVFGNILAVMMTSSIIDLFGPTAIQSYLWIFLCCGLLQLTVLFLVRKLQITKT